MRDCCVIAGVVLICWPAAAIGAQPPVAVPWVIKNETSQALVVEGAFTSSDGPCQGSCQMLPTEVAPSGTVTHSETYPGSIASGTLKVSGTQPARAWDDRSGALRRSAGWCQIAFTTTGPYTTEDCALGLEAMTIWVGGVEWVVNSVTWETVRFSLTNRLESELTMAMRVDFEGDGLDAEMPQASYSPGQGTHLDVVPQVATCTEIEIETWHPHCLATIPCAMRGATTENSLSCDDGSSLAVSNADDWKDFDIVASKGPEASLH